MTTPIALAKLGWFLMEARQHQSGRQKDVIMISPPNQGTKLWGSEALNLGSRFWVGFGVMALQIFRTQNRF